MKNTHVVNIGVFLEMMTTEFVSTFHCVVNKPWQSVIQPRISFLQAQTS
jgi:isopenicillin N synthase-like dioxygenase